MTSQNNDSDAKVWYNTGCFWSWESYDECKKRRGGSCITCNEREFAGHPCGESVKITKDIVKRSGCSGGVFDTWDTVEAGDQHE